MIYRFLVKIVLKVLEQGKSILLLGPRQTGKTTLIRELVSDRYITLADPRDRLRYEKELGALTTELEQLAESLNRMPLVLIDEIQKIPLLMDAVQDLIDRKIAKFILTGSSARKLRRGEHVNLLPGRVIPLRLDPLTYLELLKINPTLETLLLDGSLPEIALSVDIEERARLLEAYVTIYLEEEIRTEALVRELGGFARFLELAASESGKIVNFSKLSQEIGMAHTTIMGYYQILEDCLVMDRIEPLSFSKTRRRLSKAPKYLFYDLGVRRLAAREGRELPREYMGHLFEQYVGLEFIRYMRLLQKRGMLKYWRDLAGAEVDWILEIEQQFIPVEVKWTEMPNGADIKSLQIFLEEYADQAQKGYLICRIPHPRKLTDKITALPWEQLHQVFPFYAELNKLGD